MRMPHCVQHASWFHCRCTRPTGWHGRRRRTFTCSCRWVQPVPAAQGLLWLSCTATSPPRVLCRGQLHSAVLPAHASLEHRHAGSTVAGLPARLVPQMYQQAAFCLEELLLHQPAEVARHLLLADTLYTAGGAANWRAARAYYSGGFPALLAGWGRPWCAGRPLVPGAGPPCLWQTLSPGCVFSMFFPCFAAVQCQA